MNHQNHQWYYANGDERHGPVTLEVLRAQRLVADTLVWRPGMADWLPVAEVEDLCVMFGPAPAETGSVAPTGDPVFESGAANTVPVKQGEDFVVCNPRLPRFVQWVCVYAIVINPLVEVFKLIVTLGEIVALPAAEQGQKAPDMLVAAAIGLMPPALLLWGGLLLRSLRVEGVYFFATAVASNYTLQTYRLIHSAAFDPPRDAVAEPVSWTGIMTFMLFVALVTYLFEIAASTWMLLCLRRLRHLLAGTPASTPPSPPGNLALKTAAITAIVFVVTVGVGFTGLLVAEFMKPGNN